MEIPSYNVSPTIIADRIKKQGGEGRRKKIKRIFIGGASRKIGTRCEEWAFK